MADASPDRRRPAPTTRSSTPSSSTTTSSDGRRPRRRVEPSSTDLERVTARARPVPRRAASGCRPTSRTTASRRSAGSTTRSTGRRAGSSRSCCRCSTPARRPSPTAPTTSSRSGRRCSARSQKQGLERIDRRRRAVRPRASTRRWCTSRGDDGETASRSVSEVMRTGYTWKGQVLRPAMVKVKG